METRSASSLIISVVLAVAVLGYGTRLYAAESASKAYGGLLEKHQRGDAQALRVRADTDGHRLWVLTLEDVYVYKHSEARADSPDQITELTRAAAGFMCAPDMALDRRGTAFVSNNVQPRLVQISPTDFQPREHQLRLISDKQWDVGFGALSFGADGTLLGVSALGGTVFRIDLKSGSATQISRATNESCEGL